MTTEDKLDHHVHTIEQKYQFLLQHYPPWPDLQQALGHLTEAVMALWVNAVKLEGKHPDIIRREATHLTALCLKFLVERCSGELEGMTLADIRCLRCHKAYTLLVPEEGMKKWKEEGWLIQHAFPGMNASDRELLKSHLCVACWDRVVPDEDEVNATPF